MSRALTRRAVIAGAGAALGAVALPAFATPATFDAAAYVADLRALGCLVYPVPRRSGQGWTFGIASPAGLGFGEDFHRLMERWDNAIARCPDYVERTVAHLAAEWEAGT